MENFQNGKFVTVNYRVCHRNLTKSSLKYDKINQFAIFGIYKYDTYTIRVCISFLRPQE